MNIIDEMTLEKRKKRRANMSEYELNQLKPLYDEKGFPIYNEYYIMIMEDGLPWCEPTEEHFKEEFVFENTTSLFEGKVLDKPISDEQARELAIMYKKKLEKEELISKNRDRILKMKDDILNKEKDA